MGRLFQFRKDESGGVLIEAALWMPVMLSMMIMVADASVVFMNKARIEKIVSDGHRRLAVQNEIYTCGELEAWIEKHAQVIAASATATCTPTLTYTNATVTVDVSDIDLAGSMGFLGKIDMRVRSFHTSERGTS